MNKKLFVLLPAALLLAACGPKGPTSSDTGSTNTADTGSTDTGSTSTGMSDAEFYGTAEAPLTVAQYNAHVDSLGTVDNATYSDQEFYVKGIVSQGAVYSGGKYGNIFLKDKLSDSKSLKVQNAKNSASVVATAVGVNDTILVKGYAEFYNNYWNLFGGQDGYENPTIESLVRGTSTVSVTKDEHIASVSEVPATAVNGTVIDLEVTAAEGYKVGSVKVNGGLVAANTEGKYPCTVMGNTVIAIESELDAVPQDLPAGTYEVVIDYTNTGLTASAAAGTAEVVVKENTETVAYKKLAVGFINSYNQDNYKEFTIKKGGKMVIQTPTGKISSVKADYYQSQSCDVYAGDTDGAAIIGTEGAATSNNKSKVYSYDINNAVAIFDNPSNASYNQSFYTVTVTIVVE